MTPPQLKHPRQELEGKNFGFWRLRDNRQGHEIVKEKGGVILGIATFFRAGALLSEQIYKICTLLSTGFVENVRADDRETAREALPDVAFGGVPRALGAGCR